ncbi:MAG: ATP-dependent 6-phosphofructokinase [Pirellulaceae bacterium]|nr:MAG: ATP-dependent 6-phosphofructokinase [Pirellulaceae bacterium]
MKKVRRRIGILTGGGDCPGLNAVIRAATKSAIYLGYRVVGIRRGYEGLADPVQTMPLTIANTSNILNQGGTILGSTNKGRFSAKVGTDQTRQLDPGLIDMVRRNVQELELDGLICIGGDGSLSIAWQLYQAGIPIVGVPKTIDNDLQGTAFTFGFDSAVACAANALDRLHTTAASHERVMVLEVMGRHTGWIALHAGLAGGGDVILIPEIDWTFENVCAKVLQRQRMGRRFTLIVVAEGARLPDGGLVTAEDNPAATSERQVRLGGIGQIVADEVQKRLGVETRCVVLGHLQRGGEPTYFDRCLSTQYGAHAVRLIEEERFGEMVSYDPPDMTSVSIEKAIAQLHRVDPQGAAVQAARAMAVSFGDTPDYRNPFPCSHVDAKTYAEQFNVSPSAIATSHFDDYE